MNTQLLRKKIQQYFSTVSPEEIVSQYEKLGYTFIESNIPWVTVNNYELNKLLIHRNKSFMDFVKKLNRKKINDNNLTSNFSGSFFCTKIAV